MNEEQYRGLPTLAYMIRWLEEFIAILSKPFLMIGFVVSMIDLLTQGQLLRLDIIVYGWAAIQAVAVDACFFVTWHKMARAVRQGKFWASLGLALLGCALGVVAWAAMDIQSLQQAVKGLDQKGALAALNLDPVILTHLRSGVAIVMGAVVSMISPEDHTGSWNRAPRTRKEITWPRFLHGPLAFVYGVGLRLGIDPLRECQPKAQLPTPPPVEQDDEEEAITQPIVRGPQFASYEQFAGSSWEMPAFPYQFSYEQPANLLDFSFQEAPLPQAEAFAQETRSDELVPPPAPPSSRQDQPNVEVIVVDKTSRRIDGTLYYTWSRAEITWGVSRGQLERAMKEHPEYIRSIPQGKQNVTYISEEAHILFPKRAAVSKRSSSAKAKVYAVR